MFENFDLENIVTPVDHVMFEKLLIESDYDKKKIDHLISGFRDGFSIGYEGDEEVVRVT